MNNDTGLISTLVLGNLIQLLILMAGGLRHLGGRKTQLSYQGRWKFHIAWYQDWADSVLFGQPVHEPHSRGYVRLIIAGGLRRKRFTGGGFGNFTLRDGGEDYARVAVEIEGMILEPRENIYSTLRHGERLREFRLRSLVRQPLRDFKYGPFVQYHVLIAESDGLEMKGRVVYRKAGETDRPVADFQAQRDR